MAFRIVEAQHRVSTLKLADSLGEQELLEQIVEGTKPPIPEPCRGLHYLLLTPFRYPPRFDSRFRKAGSEDGVFYASETPETAVAELSFYRLLFFSESPDTPLPTNPGDYTCFEVHLKSRAALDMTRKPFGDTPDLWSRIQDYSPCHALADTARKAGTEVISYLSVRDPSKGRNFAVLSCTAFARKDPVSIQTWRIQLRLDGALATCEAPRLSLKFDLAGFLRDTRLIPFAKRSA